MRKKEIKIKKIQKRNKNKKNKNPSVGELMKKKLFFLIYRLVLFSLIYKLEIN
tara:strand:- start:700 stop:858 length:159 start_codon:yes stop_codon:yes gene_type:complete